MLDLIDNETEIRHWNPEATSVDYNRLLKLSMAINKADLAGALLEKLDYKAFTVSSMPNFLKLKQAYGVNWCIDVLKKLAHR